MGRFYSPTAHATVGSTSEATEARLAEAGLTACQDLLTIAEILPLIAVLTALLIEVEDAEAAEGFARGRSRPRRGNRRVPASTQHSIDNL